MEKAFSNYSNLNPYIIAEIGVNHECNINLAKQLIDEAKEAGAHAAKFQSYKANKIASKNSPAYWNLEEEPTDSQYKLFKKLDKFTTSDYLELAQYCEEKEIDFLSTPFDLDALRELAPHMKYIKIASADLTNIPLIRAAASTGKPIILSTGASNYPEIQHAINELEANGGKDITLLHCVLNYPTPIKNANLKRIKELRKIFSQYTIGYSDHVAPDESMSALEVACLYGAVVIEKHFTHNKSLKGNDHYHSMDKTDLIKFKKKLIKFRDLNGSDTDFSAEKNEQKARLHARRSIVSDTSIKKGQVFTEDNLTTKRPGHGIPPLLWDSIIGKTASIDIPEDTIIDWDMIK